jgi:hypothetical protein
MNAPSEINAAALKASTAEKHTPMMQQYLRAILVLRIFQGL